VQITFTKNPLKKESVLGDVIEAFDDQTIVWLTTQAEQHKLAEEDMATTTIMTWPDAVFDQICLDSKVFIKKSICRDQITDEYIDNHLQTTKHLLLEINRKEALAMAIFDVRESTIFVHLLCSSPRAPGGGTRLMKALMKYFKNHPTLTAIRLESVTGAKAFYSKIGFTPCFDGHLCPMEYQRGRLSPVRSRPTSGTKTRKSKSKSKLTE
jgi:predicted GNAT family N-acyltransferase